MLLLLRFFPFLLPLLGNGLSVCWFLPLTTRSLDDYGDVCPRDPASLWLIAFAGDVYRAKA